MKTPAIIASLTVVGSIAYAAGSQGTVGKPKQPPVMPPMGSQMHSMQEMPQSRMQVTGGCDSGVDRSWFTIGHDLPECATVYFWGLEPTGRMDVNGDGEAEVLLAPATGSYGSYSIVANGEATQFAQISVHEINTAGGSYSESVSCVLRNEAGNYFRSRVPSATDVGAYFFLRDMDGDGDMDLVVDAEDFSADGSGGSLKFWLENTGFQHTNHIAADLNHDGKVDGNDLATLLAAWGPTQ
jgi:hypothetical protein